MQGAGLTPVSKNTYNEITGVKPQINNSFTDMTDNYNYPISSTATT